MDFRKLLEADCGQNNPISQLLQHVTQDQRLQESIGSASAHGLNQHSLMHPQSFRMDDLIKEIGLTESQNVPMSSPSLFHDDVQDHSFLGATWSPNYYQNQFQEAAQNMYWFRESQHFMQNEYRPNEIQMSSHFESNPQGPDESLTEFQDMITIESLDELKELHESAEYCTTYSQKTQDEPLPEKCGNRERKTIPEFISTTHFKYVMNKFVRNYCKQEWNRKHPNQEYKKFTREHLLQAKEYSYIENNPMRDELKPYEKGKNAFKKACYSETILHFEEALRRNETSVRTWLKLSRTLYINDQDDRAISAIKRYLQFKPTCHEGTCLMFDIYNAFRCKYQACQSVFNWLKNNKSYKHLIPPGFTMDDKETSELDENLLNSVKNIFLKAAQKNPVKADADLQIMIGNLYHISRDYDKVADCKRTAINNSKYCLVQELYNMGNLLFSDDKPNEALDNFLEVAAKSECKINIYKSIGFVYMYLQNYKEAIRYFRKELDLKSSDHESRFQLQGNTLEDEYELCVQLYCEIRFLRNNSYN